MQTLINSVAHIPEPLSEALRYHEDATVVVISFFNSLNSLPSSSWLLPFCFSFSHSLLWNWGTRCGPLSGRLGFALTHWAAWTLFPPTATSTWCRSPTPKALPLPAGLSASVLVVKTPSLAWTLTKVGAAHSPLTKKIRTISTVSHFHCVK